MIFRVEFIENDQAFHTFVEAVSSDEAVKNLRETFESMRREVSVMDCYHSERPVDTVSRKLAVTDRELKSETRVRLNNG